MVQEVVIVKATTSIHEMASVLVDKLNRANFLSLVFHQLCTGTATLAAGNQFH